MIETLPFNFNEHILIRLTDKGISKWVEKHNQIPKLPDNLKLTVERLKELRDSEGFFPTTINTICKVFGGVDPEMFEMRGKIILNPF